MKKSERILLDNLQGDELPEETPLKNVKEGLGSIAYTTGDPKTKTEIKLHISVRYTTLAGVPILPAALNPDVQTFVPLVLFGLTDLYGGYGAAQKLVPANNPWQYQSFVINGYTWPLIAVPGGVLGENGDLRITMTAPASIFPLPQQPFAYIRVRCDNVAYGTFLNSFVSDLITVDAIRIIVPVANINQLINPVIFGYQSLFGTLKTDSIDPRQYITSRDFQQQICDIPLNLPIDKALIMCMNINFDCTDFDIILFVKKVQALTNRPSR